VGGIPQAEIYNIMRDPREEHPKMAKGNALVFNIPFQRLIASHMQMKKKFPDRVLKP
jgi:hypothetical protein